MKVLVTGGTGFIGSTLVRHLIAAGHQVRVLVRQRKDSFLLENLNIEVVNGDVTHIQSVEKAVQGCDVVFNLASLYAFYPFWVKDPKTIYRINVQGTVHMLEASLKYHVKKFIHTSTIATLSARPDGKPADESSGFEPRGASHYARSKYIAEEKVFEFVAKGLPAVILNPGIVIGERDHKPTPSGDVIVKFLNGSYPGYFDTRWSVADADDVALAHIAAMERGRNGERYILCDNEHYTLQDVFQLLEKITGIRAPRFKIPYWFLLGFTYLDEALSHILFRKRPLMPTEGVKFCKMTAVYDNSKAVRDLGYRPTPFEETLRKAVSWYRKNAYVEPRGIFRIKAHGSPVVRFIMQSLRMSHFTDKLNLGTLGFFGAVKFLGLLRKAGAGRGTDGWRKVTECYLRTEQSKFVLAVFGLDLWSDLKESHETTLAAAKQHCRQRLAQFLKTYPVFYNQLQWGAFDAKPQAKRFLDLVEADFDGEGRLLRLVPYLDADTDPGQLGKLPPSVQDLLIRGILEIYNATKDLEDKERPLIFKKKLDFWLSEHPAAVPGECKGQACAYVERIISAVFFRFEGLPSSASSPRSGRFQAPSFIKTKHPGFGILNVACRLSEDLLGADLWIQF
ncbi:MAG TPA: SDR family oxidoreductase, partial [Candidatus Omnitrophota bacterium]|nr:SDR family oxidoreductase [Candidatus Omnitrophota bacterium]